MQRCRILLVFTAFVLTGLVPWFSVIAANPNSYVTNQTQTLPVSGSGLFEAAMKCVDDMALRSNISGITLVPWDMEEAGGMRGATRDMIAFAGSRMSERSGLFNVYSAAGDVRTPESGSYIIAKGSIAAFDQGVNQSSKSAGISVFDKIGPGINRQKISSVLTLTLYFTQNEIMLPRTAQKLSVTINGSSNGTDLTASIPFLGAFINTEMTRQEGPMQALNMLVDLAMIQAVGAYTRLPVERCLAGRTSDPAARVSAQKAFAALKPPEQIAAIATRLAELGMFKAPPTVVLTSELRGAIVQFQENEGAPAMGLIDADLYYRLFKEKFGAAPAQIGGNFETASIKIAGEGVSWRRLEDQDYKPAVLASVPYGFSISVARSVHLACFHTDGQGHTTRVFPTDAVTSDVVEPGRPLRLPDAKDGFDFFSHATPDETLTCIASSAPVSSGLPQGLNGPPLTRLAPLNSEEILIMARKAKIEKLESAVFHYSVIGQTN